MSFSSTSGASTCELDNAEENSVQDPKPIKPLSEILKDLKSSKASSETKAIEQLTEVIESGAECDVQTLYEGPAKCDCCINWVDVYPDDLKSSIEQEAETKKKALVIRLSKNHNEGRPLALNSIVVQNQQIKELLGQVFHGYKGITPNLKKLVLRAPFRPFFHRWSLFKDLVDEQKASNDVTASFSQLLYRILDLELRETMDEIEDLCGNGVITFGLLWALFQPGIRLYSSIDGQDRFFLLESGEYVRGSPFFLITAKYVDWDGERFGFATARLSIGAFEGTMNINELNVYPTVYHKSEQEVASALKRRGKSFRGLRGMHYRAYAGDMLLRDKCGTAKKLDARVIIDASMAPPHLKPIELIPLDDFSVSPEIRVEDDVHEKYPRRQWRRADEAVPRPVRETLNPEKLAMPAVLTDEQLMLCNSHVAGYSLKDKVWGDLAIRHMKEVVWNDDAFPSLILPQGHKGLILAFVNGQLTDKQDFDDVIEGKGQGLTILLVGTPGTGKTLTAEAVADKVRRPLYILSAGELGQEAEKVEQKLKTVLELAEKWRAVLLLDECDVFLEKRTNNNLNHNEVVAVFLRLLEYYPGILFLTTNRADAIDPAFQSRIHLTLHYPELNQEARKNIWTQFCSRLAQSSLCNDDLTSLSELPLNGRQIKNIIKISALLARQDATALQLGHIQTVLNATKELGLDG
ncbi:hypothetical protein QQS21_000111 [Conoideocrella luteorostrata]|uniref:AAA+ ATPase domain-containing protein n=1 Tax=Conoideocrella luteorostrata TaxID=1105319 RepID=A0AAJ0D0B6_9HYPO|nr:hypothetical protein QQS21_000111 [Conoideocrella luteorostrata]